MCGIIGIHNRENLNEETLPYIRQGIQVLSHRGPDGRGIYIDDKTALGQARLSIIDLEGGQQPISNEDESLWLVCNGEIFNYIELRKNLVQKGHRFRTKTDVEVLLHLFEEYNTGLFEQINGQYAFAIWDRKNKKLLIARDHVGICPLYYWRDKNQIVFASEMKALFQMPFIKAEIHLPALLQTFTFWSPLPGETPFKNIHEVKPGCYLTVTKNSLIEKRYWNFEYSENGTAIRDANEAIPILQDLLNDAVKIRLRSDVPVGAYLSGGLDSTLTTALIKKKNGEKLRTFSIGFANRQYDETPYQRLASKFLNTAHSSFTIHDKDILKSIKDVVWHAEKPLLRTSPAPLFLLSKAVHNAGFKVVLTGEGADEFFSGYNIFKETKVRYFNARQPNSNLRPLLFSKLYPYLDKGSHRIDNYWQTFFQKGLLDTADPFYSHRLRWQNGSFIANFLSKSVAHELQANDPIADLAAELDGHFTNYGPILRSYYLESYIFLGSYLLCSQGDRMIMSHSVEGRYPFLDRRVIEFANSLSPQLKLKGLNEKWILKKAFGKYLPPQITSRNKQPYRGPIRSVFKSNSKFIESWMNEDRINQDKIFDARKVSFLKRKLNQSDHRISEREEMALMAILTTELLVDQFIHSKALTISSFNSSTKIVDKRQFTMRKEHAAI